MSKTVIVKQPVIRPDGEKADFIRVDTMEEPPTGIRVKSADTGAVYEIPRENIAAIRKD